jgi:hypothetical protein
MVYLAYAALEAPQRSLTRRHCCARYGRRNQERELMQLHRCQACPFIVRLFGFVEDPEADDACFFLQEWAEGGDLAGMLSVSDATHIID